MAVWVPNTDTFSLQNVFDAVDAHSNPSPGLASCYANAIAGYFDPAYNNDGYAVANGMRRFRNYGPKTPPVENVYTLPFPSYGIRAVGRLIYVSPGGANIYVVISLMYATQVHQLVRFTMSNPFDLTTVQYHSERNISDPANGFTFKTLRFSDDGMRFMLMSDNQLYSTSKNPLVWTFGLPAAWDSTNANSFYVTTPISTLSNHLRRHMRVCFSENGQIFAMYTRLSNWQYLDYFNLATAFTLPAGNINANSYKDFCNQDIGNELLGLELYETTLNKVELGLRAIPSGDLAVGTIQIDSGTLYAGYPYVSLYTTSYYAGFADMFSTPDRAYTYWLESNTNSIDPLNPRIYLKIN